MEKLNLKAEETREKAEEKNQTNGSKPVKGEENVSKVGKQATGLRGRSLERKTGMQATGNETLIGPILMTGLPAVRHGPLRGLTRRPVHLAGLRRGDSGGHYRTPIHQRIGRAEWCG